MRVYDRDLIRGGHYGQRSCEPHLQAEHMAAPTNAAKREESSCQLGAVHTGPSAMSDLSRQCAQKRTLTTQDRPGQREHQITSGHHRQMAHALWQQGCLEVASRPAMLA